MAMSDDADTRLTMQPELYRFLGQVIFRLRWATLIVVLITTFVLPKSHGIPLPTRALVGVFAAYNLTVDLLRRRMAPSFHSPG
jgi:hypothetical protein